jgi:peptidoglycan/LPS O-acetylase OafA/YrhL
MRLTGHARRSLTRVAIITVLLLLIPLALMFLSEGTDWGVFDFVFAGAIIAGAGLLIEFVVRSRGVAAYAAAAVAGLLGVGAMVAGEADDAPGLAGFGLLLLLSMVALTVRNVQRSQ